MKNERDRNSPPPLSIEEETRRRLEWIDRVNSLTNGHDGSDQQLVIAYQI